MAKLLAKLTLLVCLASLVVPIVLPGSTASAFPDNCGLHPSNLFRNGSMAPGHDTRYGVVANEWEPFILSASAPRFEWVDNEKWDANGAQYFWSDGTAFDAGIYQTVGNLKPGVYYRFRIGYSHARLDPGNAQNEVSPNMGRQVGVDALGGTDPRSPNVVWGPAVFNSSAGMNLPELTMTFAARGDKATIYFRGINKGNFGRAKVWFDVACMEPLYDLPTATSLAPTAPPLPPTATPKPQVVRVASPTATRIPATRTATVTQTPAASPTAAATSVPTEVPRVLSARPVEADASTLAIELEPSILLTGLGISSIAGSFVFFAIGLVLARRMR